MQRVAANLLLFFLCQNLEQLLMNTRQTPDNSPSASSMEAAVVIPTLNEAGNIEALLGGILAADARLHAIVVDDGSADGTAKMVEAIAIRRVKNGEEQRVHLIARGRKLGYASAVQDGMRLALDSGAQLILQMDADFSHDPHYLP